jgi:hypothetical protein
MAVPFIGRRGEWRGREAGGEAPTGGASITHQLLEEEATTTSIQGENEEDPIAHLFLFHLALEGDRRRHEEWRRRPGWTRGHCRLEVGDDLRWASLGLNRPGN